MNFYPDQKSPNNEPAAPMSLWHRIRPGADDGRTSLLFWLTVLGLGCTSLLFVTWGASALLAKKGSEKLLRVDLLLPKLNSIHGDRKPPAFRMSEPGPSELAHPKDRQTSTSAHPLPSVVDHPHGGTVVETPHHTPEPLVHMMPHGSLAPPMLETCDEPVIFVHPCTPQPGDSPMIHNWKVLTMYSLLSAATAVLAPPPLAVATEPKTDAIEEVRKSLKEIKDRLDKIENKKAPEFDQNALLNAIRAEIKKLEDGSLTKINEKIEGVKTGVDGLKGETAALREEQLRQKIHIEHHKLLIDQLTKKLDTAPTAPTVDKAMMETLKAIQEGLAKLGPTKERISMSAPNGTTTTPSGRVMLVNQYSDDLLFIINNGRYRVPAYSSRLVESVTPGSVSIEVAADRWGIFNRQVTTLAAGELFTLTATPPR